MIKQYKLSVDFNGIVIFNYPNILELFGGRIQNGQNILKDFTSSNLGEVALDKGIALPILGLDDGDYLVRFYIDQQPENKNRKIIFSDKYFYLDVSDNLYVADIIIFWDWDDYTGWNKIDIPQGIYKICLEGVHLLNDEGQVLEHSYDLLMTSVPTIGIRNLEPRSDSRL
ncbi:hypothetical protein [Thorsellia kenyensis]|uniref:Uncharacterized protein n=1 Tax=Thorsellia kenyensis TaxID=1549888 RepID=A0ABV6CAF4_9GAMM